jgi:hypothetical protein
VLVLVLGSCGARGDGTLVRFRIRVDIEFIFVLGILPWFWVDVSVSELR